MSVYRCHETEYLQLKHERIFKSIRIISQWRIYCYKCYAKRIPGCVMHQTDCPLFYVLVVVSLAYHAVLLQIDFRWARVFTLIGLEEESQYASRCS